MLKHKFENNFNNEVLFINKITPLVNTILKCDKNLICLWTSSNRIHIDIITTINATYTYYKVVYFFEKSINNIFQNQDADIIIIEDHHLYDTFVINYILSLIKLNRLIIFITNITKKNNYNNVNVLSSVFNIGLFNCDIQYIFFCESHIHESKLFLLQLLFNLVYISEKKFYNYIKIYEGMLFFDTKILKLSANQLKFFKTYFSVVSKENTFILSKRKVSLIDLVAKHVDIFLIYNNIIKTENVNIFLYNESLAKPFTAENLLYKDNIMHIKRILIYAICQYILNYK